MTPSGRPGLAVRVLVALATVKLALGAAGLLVGEGTLLHGGPAGAFIPVQMLVYAGMAALLLLGGRSGSRTLSLGCFFLLVASAYATRGLRALEDAQPGLAGVAWALRSFHMEALLPAFLWRFFRDFPSGVCPARVEAQARYGLRASLWAGSALLSMDAAGIALGSAGSPLRLSESPLYYPVVLVLTLAALLYGWTRARAALISAEERRRVRLFIGGLAVGAGPMAVAIVAEAAFPPLDRWTSRPAVAAWLTPLLELCLLSVPLTTAASVRVHRVLEVRLILRRAARYALARYTILAAAAVPAAALAAFVFRHRGETVSALVARPETRLLAAATGVTLVAFALRTRILDGLDRRFFREDYDARRILADLVDRSRSASSVPELVSLLSGEIDRALHLDRVSALVNDGDSGWLVCPDGSLPPLSTTSELATLLLGSPAPLEVDLELPPIGRLPLHEREWIADAGASLLVPLTRSDGVLLGALVLGTKKSDLSYSNEDRLLLRAISSSAAMALENQAIRSTPVPGQSGPILSVGAGAEGAAALLCPPCGSLHPPDAARCRACGSALVPCEVPYVLPGRFRFEHRIGAGGMGVVYRAVDLALGRTVAIKTLPRASPEFAMRLRREARAAASISHPNLALILGAEAWRGRPMLVFELLEGGTLADRLARAPLQVRPAVELALVLASVLEKAHGAGILHRDIKPANVGFTREGTPKLMDFGLARALDDTRLEQAVLHAADHAQQDTAVLSPDAMLGPATRLGVLVGTPAYMPPEALDLAPADAHVDLWAVALVLYESVAGLNPLSDRTLVDTLVRVRACVIPPLEDRVRGMSAPLDAFLQDALARDRRRRPQTAREFRERLASAAPPPARP